MIARERRGHVDVVRLDDPPLHRFGAAMASAVREAFEAVASDPPRVAVLCCGGAGADIRQLAALTPDTARAFITDLHDAIRAVRDLDVPVIGAVDGPCFGAHLELAAACDLRVCSRGSRLGMPEVKVGVPSVVDACLLAVICGTGEASRLVFEGEPVDASEALRIGLVNRVADDALAEALAWAERIAEASPVALSRQKRVVRAWTRGWYEDAVRRSIEHFAETFEAPEAREALTAFLEKRPARF